MLRAFALFLTLSTGAAQAACTGPSLIDRFSPEQQARLDQAIAGTPYAEGLFWTATRGDRVLTLVGTMHLYDERHLPLSDRLATRVAEQDLLLVEATGAEEAALQDAMLRQPELVFITEGPTLPEMLDEATWQALIDAMRARGMPPVIGSRMQPWFLMMTLSMPPCAMDDVLNGRTGLDHMLIDLADGFGTPVAALEPWDTLFTLMSTSTQQEQIDLLRTGLMDEAMQEELFVAMLDGYFAGRVAEVWEVSRIALDFMPLMDPVAAAAAFRMTEDLLLEARNRAWIDVIEDAAARDDRIMVAVGAAHMPGDHGVLNLLAQNGWTIAPLD